MLDRLANFAAASTTRVCRLLFETIVDWINQNTRPQAVVLMCWDAREYRLQRRTIIDPGRNRWEQLFAAGRATPQEIAEHLRSQNVEYVLVNEGSLRYNVFVVPNVLVKKFDVFQQQRDLLVPSALQPVFERKRVKVYRVAERST